MSALESLFASGWLTNAFVLAVLGYGAKYVNDLRLARRKDELDRVNRQLADLYGPLFACSAAADIAWQSFREKYRPKGAFFDGTGMSDSDLLAWRLWISEVFMPLNVQMEAALIRHADLLCEPEVPQCLLELSAHVAAYKPVLARWKANDFSEHTSTINFPIDVQRYAAENFKKLKARQATLLGHSAQVT